MKNLNLFDKLIAITNSVFAFFLLLSYSCYYINPNAFPLISFLSLLIPVLILINLFFMIYWLIKLKKQLLISFVALLIGFPFLTKLYGINNKKTYLNSDIKLMSYNVRLFNLYNWIKGENFSEKITEFIVEKSPDILCIQEYHPNKKLEQSYPFHYIKIKENKNRFGDAIFSKFKIIHSGSLNFKRSNNNAIFADIVNKRDTFRVYNVHLESLHINPKKDSITKKNTEKYKINIQNAFKKQATQVKTILKHQNQTKYKTIISGDFNNNAFSWVYHQLKNNKNDAFETAGSGFGSTFKFTIPLRIDFILADTRIAVNNYKTFKVSYSDHYPIMARINLNKP